MTTAEKIDTIREERHNRFVKKHGKFDRGLYYKEILEGKCEHKEKKEL